MPAGLTPQLGPGPFPGAVATRSPPPCFSGGEADAVQCLFAVIYQTVLIPVTSFEFSLHNEAYLFKDTHVIYSLIPRKRS